MNLETLGLAPLTADLSRVEVALTGAVRNSDAFLTEVAAHLLNAGGKRLRPTLTLASYYAACGAERASDSAITGSAAVELVHLGSLYHDDVIDEAETRRGVPSVNARWNNITAILSGDYLLAKASGLAASLGADVAGLLAATISELCRGEVLELAHLFDADRTVASYLSAIDGKTAALFATSCRIGGMVAGVSESTLQALDTFGRNLGMSFQIIDDVLDITADITTLGKPAGTDMAEGVYNLPVLYALESEPALRPLLGGPMTEQARTEAHEIVVHSRGVESALTVAREHVEAASTALGQAVGLDHNVVARLRVLVTSLLERPS